MKMAADLKDLVTFWLVLFLICCSVKASVLISSDCATDIPTDPSCSEIDDGFAGLKNGATLSLASGSHLIKKSHFNHTLGLSNITITGHGPQETIIRCNDGYGLVFFGIKNLTIENLTIESCGSTREELMVPVNLLEEVIDLFYVVPPTAMVAVFLADCEDVMIRNVNITDTTGLGLLGINVVGNSIFSQVSFVGNVRPKCSNVEPTFPSLITPDILDQVGGGAYFLYADYFDRSRPNSDIRVLIEDGYFAYNADCTYASITSINYQYYTNNATGLYDYAIGAGGGLSVILSNSHFAVNVAVTGSTFFQNDARYGGGAYVASFAGFQANIDISFLNCDFIENGISIPEESNCRGGGGLAVFTDFVKPQHFVTPIPASNAVFTMLINGVTFYRNQAAYQGGGLMVYSLFNSPHSTLNNRAMAFYMFRWLVSNTRFDENIALYSSAAYFNQMASNGIFGSARLSLDNVNATQNSFQDSRDLQNLNDDASVFHLRNFVAVVSSAIFSNNLGSALRLESSVLLPNPASSVVFQQNVARRGGALHFSGQFGVLALTSSSIVKFISNRAILEGGAIFFSSQTDNILQPLDYDDCFIVTTAYSSSVNPDGNFQLFDQNSSLIFRRNTAPLGSLIFGSSLENCLWSRNVSRTEGLSLYQTLHRNYSSLFNFDSDPVGEARVSSLPAQVKVKPLKNGLGESISLYPGQVMEVKIEVLDMFNKTIPAIVTTSTYVNVSAQPLLGDSGFWYTAVDVSDMSISGEHRGLLNVSILTATNSLSSDLLIDLLPCPIGFVPEEQSQTPRCVCDERLADMPEITCLNDSVSFAVGTNTWVGIDKGNDTTENLIVHRCIFTFCSGEANVAITPPIFGMQCAANRMGFLCSECAPNHSHVFGTEACVEGCTYFSLLLIPVFLLAATAFFAILILLELTIDKGLVNVAWFSFNSLSCFLALFGRPTKYPFILLPLRLATLQLGVNTCFYPGMTIPERTTFLFLVPLYMFVLVAISNILRRNCEWVMQRYCPYRILVTLAFLCYFSILTTSISIVTPTQIKTVGGRVYYAWLLAPSIPYSSAFHVILTIVAFFLIIFYLIAFPLLLLFPKLLQKFGRKALPLLKIAWAPYKPKYRYWQGVRVTVIGILYLLSQYPGTPSYIISGVIIICFLGIQSTILPFEDKLTNHFDTSLVVVTSLCFWGFRTILEDGFTREEEIVSTTFEFALILAAAVLHVMIYGLHIHRQFPSLYPKSLKILASIKNLRKSKEKNKPSVTVVEVDNMSFSNEDGVEEDVEANGSPSSDYNLVQPSTASFHTSIEFPHSSVSITDISIDEL